MKTALAVISPITFFLIVVSPTAFSANANPNWRPWESALSPPIITVLSPIENQSCISSEVILNFTVTKPADWLDSNLQMRYVAYCVDGFIDGVADENETIVEVHDSMDADKFQFFLQSYRAEGWTTLVAYLRRRFCLWVSDRNHAADKLHNLDP
jgi:hypothetical protein